MIAKNCVGGSVVSPKADESTGMRFWAVRREKTDQFRFCNIHLICFLFIKSGAIDKCVRGVINSSGIAYDSDKKKDDAVGRLVEVVQGARSGLAKFGEPDSSLK